jgi:hypothetical protein
MATVETIPRIGWGRVKREWCRGEFKYDFFDTL